MQSDLSRKRNLPETVEDKFITMGFDFATILSSFLFLHLLRHRFGAANQAGILSAASRTEMADVKQMKKIVPLITCEITYWSKCLRVDVWCQYT